MYMYTVTFHLLIHLKCGIQQGPIGFSFFFSYLSFNYSLNYFLISMSSSFTDLIMSMYVNMYLAKPFIIFNFSWLDRYTNNSVYH